LPPMHELGEYSRSRVAASKSRQEEAALLIVR
jgi:hypothetical protein